MAELLKEDDNAFSGSFYVAQWPGAVAWQKNPHTISLLPGNPLASYAMEKCIFKIIAPAVFEKLKMKDVCSGFI